MKKHIHHGYSIIEILVYLAIFSIMTIVVIRSSIAVTRSFDQTRANRDVLESADVSLEHMSREIRQAKSIDVSDSTFDANPSTLSLISADSSGNPLTIEYVVENDTLDLYENGALVGPLTAPNISVDSLIFRHITTAEGEAVKIEMALRDTSIAASAAEHFYDTIVLQGEYQ